MGTVIEIDNLVKRYKELIALDHLKLTVEEGEIFGLLGPNGSGKTTAINCILALLYFDKGSVKVFGEEIQPNSYEIKKKIGVVLQNVAVFEELTVQENIDYFCGLYIGDKKLRKQYVEEAIVFSGLEDFRKFYPKKLSGGLLRRLNIACGIAHKPKLIIMDEPTTAITKKEVRALFNVIRDLQKQNIAILFVSHKLDEVFEIAERFTIFRNGKNTGAGDASELTQEKFTYYMTGREIKETPFIYEEKPGAKKVLELKNLNLKNGFKNVNLSLGEGEILGITGLLGSGRTELVQALFGYHKADSGEIYIRGKKVQINSVKDGIKNGIGYVPPERIVEGVFLPQSIKQNISIEKWDEWAGPLGIMNEKKIEEVVNDWVKKLRIKLHSIEDPMNTLSGGNQQKCVLAKWLILDLNVLILNGPTVGVDIGAKFDIYELVKSLAANGLSVIIISDDIPEILSNCNRVVVMRRGEIVKEGLTKDMDEASLAEFAVAD